MRSTVSRGRVCAALCVAIWGCSFAPTSARAQIERTSVIPVNRINGQGAQPAQALLIQGGDSGRRTRQAAIQQIPMEQLTPAGQQQVREILKDLSLFRRLPTLQIDVDRRAYEFFTEHPDVAVSIWRALDISNVQMKRIDSHHYQTDTQDGTVGNVDVLLRSPNNYLVLCSGLLQSPGMPRPIQAQALMHLQPRFDGDGKVVHHLDLFVRFPSTAVEAIARLISPVSFRIADRNFEEVTLFVSLMSGAMARQPGWVEQIAQRLEGVSPERPQELLKVTAAVYVDAEKRRLAAMGQPVTAESIQPPVAVDAASLNAPVAR